MYTSLRFHPLHLYPIYGPQEGLPIAEHLSEHGLKLPLHHRREAQDVERVCDLLREFRTSRV